MGGGEGINHGRKTGHLWKVGAKNNRERKRSKVQKTGKRKGGL